MGCAASGAGDAGANVVLREAIFRQREAKKGREAWTRTNYRGHKLIEMNYFRSRRTPKITHIATGTPAAPASRWKRASKAAQINRHHAANVNVDLILPESCGWHSFLPSFLSSSTIVWHPGPLQLRMWPPPPGLPSFSAAGGSWTVGAAGRQMHYIVPAS